MFYGCRTPKRLPDLEEKLTFSLSEKDYYWNRRETDERREDARNEVDVKRTGSFSIVTPSLDLRTFRLREEIDIIFGIPLVGFEFVMKFRERWVRKKRARRV